MDAPTTMAASGNKRNNHPLPWLNLMATEPFYLFHFFTFFSYFVARSSAAQNLSPDLAHHLFRREMQAVITFSVLTAIKMVKEETWDAFIADTLFYGKGFLFGVSLIIDYHLALCYMVAFLVIFVLTQQPPYDGLGDLSHLTPLQLESLLTEGNTSRFWLPSLESIFHAVVPTLVGVCENTTAKVEFRALCSSTCIWTSRIFPDLSITYSNKNISFGIIDLGHFPNVAERFGISLSDQLPTYILFDNASEVARLPDINTTMPTVTKNILCKHFELDRRLIEYISRK